MRIVQEVIRPGAYIFKVIHRNGALMYHGTSESVAMSILTKLKELESGEGSRSNGRK